MKGPTPIISSMLKRTAERRPMRRSRGAEIEEDCGICWLVMRLHGAGIHPAEAKLGRGTPGAGGIDEFKGGRGDWVVKQTCAIRGFRK